MSSMKTVIFTTCIVYIFVPVKSQKQLFNPSMVGSFQSSSFSGSRSASVASISSSGLSTSSSSSQSAASSNLQQLPPLPDPNVKCFAYSLSRLLQASDVLKDFNYFGVYVPYNLLLKIGKIILARDNFHDPDIIDFAAKVGNDVGLAISQLYFDTLGFTFAKLFANLGLMSRDVAANYPPQIVAFVEGYAKQNGMDGLDTSMSTVSNGLHDFVTSLGLNNSGNFKLAMTLFAQEMAALASGKEIPLSADCFQ